jgi:polysaccharide export outer membrane protein
MNELRRVFVLAAALNASTALASGAQTAPDPRMQPPTEYSIGAGDVLRIVTWKEADFSGSFLVRYDGRITMPLVGDLLVSGRTPDQLSKELEKTVGRFVEMARVTVAIEEPNSAQFFVLGKVAQQGAFPYTRPIRVAQALAIAGGFQEFAKLSRIFVIRDVDGRLISFPFNYDDFMDKKELGGNLILQPGDTIVVP